MEAKLQQGGGASEGVNVRYGLAALQRDWRRCSLSSDFVGSASFEPRFAQRVVSGAVNELLELVFRLGSDGDGTALTVRSQDDQAVIELDVPLAPAVRAGLQARIEEIGAAGPQRFYLEQLGSDQEPEPLFGILQLMSDYGAQLVSSMHDNGIRLTLTLSTATERRLV